MPRVLNKGSDKIAPDAIYVGRPSKWGNSFKIGDIFRGEKLTRERAIEVFEEWLLDSLEGQELQKELWQLKGKDLVCWCSPLPCHADILLELANLT